MKIRILFVCMANVNRSKAFERYYKEKLDPEKVEVRSAGVYSGYPYQVNHEIVDWADYIFVMDLEQHRFIKERWPEKEVRIIGVSDQYNVDDEALLNVIKYWDKEFFKGLM